jgi:hypothetical protein
LVHEDAWPEAHQIEVVTFYAAIAEVACDDIWKDILYVATDRRSPSGRRRVVDEDVTRAEVAMIDDFPLLTTQVSKSIWYLHFVLFREEC